MLSGFHYRIAFFFPLQAQLKVFTCRSNSFLYRRLSGLITVFEEEQRRPAFFDYSLAWKKYGGGEWDESVLALALVWVSVMLAYDNNR